MGFAHHVQRKEQPREAAMFRLKYPCAFTQTARYRSISTRSHAASPAARARATPLPPVAAISLPSLSDAIPERPRTSNSLGMLGCESSRGRTSRSADNPSPTRARSAPARRYGAGASLTSGPAAITLAPADRADPIMSQAARRIVAKHILLKKLKLSS